jgi:hypothetical protein
VLGLSPSGSYSSSMTEVAARERITFSVDDRARVWFEGHPDVSRLFTSLMSTRSCCSGARMCDVRMRVNVDSSRHANALATWIPKGRVEGCDVFIDARLVERMPAHTRLTARGLGPFRRLDLDLTGEQWGELLYPPPH